VKLSVLRINDIILLWVGQTLFSVLNGLIGAMRMGYPRRKQIVFYLLILPGFILGKREAEIPMAGGTLPCLVEL
jgi:hypothetical protein